MAGGKLHTAECQGWSTFGLSAGWSGDSSQQRHALLGAPAVGFCAVGHGQLADVQPQLALNIAVSAVREASTSTSMRTSRRQGHARTLLNAPLPTKTKPA
jgi:hypothetical protein